MAGSPPKNVIILIGDGMGFEQVLAASYYLSGEAGTLSFESFPHQADMMTDSASSSVTDSAAAATAMATGVKVNNGVISLALPGDGSELKTLLEYFKERLKSTGLVTTTNITHATPAGFGAHESSRNNTSQIAGDYLNQTRPNVLLGGGGDGMSVSSAQTAGYTTVTTATEMLNLDTDALSMLSGQFGSGYMPYEYDGLLSLPHLSQMTATALDVLDDDPDGFFLMVEGGRIDHACHSNDLIRGIYETIEFSNSVQTVIDWAAGRSDTLILVTADHETGGLTVLTNNGEGTLPTVTWSSGGHTGVPVPLYAWGVNADLVTGTLDNTDLFAIVTADAGADINIFGYVLDAEDAPIENVMVSPDGGSAVATDALGHYALVVPENWSGTVVPAKAGYTFSPYGLIYESLMSDQIDQNYVGMRLAAPMCEDFELGYIAGDELRTHPDWFYELIHLGPQAAANIGVNGSWGLTSGNRAFTWSAHEFDWNDPVLLGVTLKMDFETDEWGHFEDDLVGWTISKTDDDSAHIFGIQLDPGADGINIEGYWEGVNSLRIFYPIVDVPPLYADSWYRLQAVITKIGATSARIDVELWSLDASGNIDILEAAGSIVNTATIGADAPDIKYFTAAGMWPVYRNFDKVPGAADNACFEKISAAGCLGDFTVNGTVDGSDLAVLVGEPSLLGIDMFAVEFGRNGCP